MKRKCRICGCTDDNCEPCFKRTGEPCWWIENDLCSACTTCEICDHFDILLQICDLTGKGVTALGYCEIDQFKSRKDS